MDVAERYSIAVGAVAAALKAVTFLSVEVFTSLF